MFGRIGTGELILILIIALIVVGPSKLPELGKTLGKSLNEFKKFSKEMKDDLSIDEKADKTDKTDKKETIEKVEILDTVETTEKSDIDK